MYKYIVFLSLCVSFAVCDLGKSEGDECEWNGLKGKCVNAKRCLTTLERNPEHPVCSTQGNVRIICCTDCELINDTSNVVFSPRSGFYMKDGRKARDACLQYLDDLPYKCREGGFYSGIQGRVDEEKKCLTYNIWGVGGAPPPGRRYLRTPFPHEVLLGYGNDVKTAKWEAGGAIISNKYILVDATSVDKPKTPNFVALGVLKRSDSTRWQTHKVKRVIVHPQYEASQNYFNIALLETETTITFNVDVLPACLNTEFLDDDQAIATTWKNLKNHELLQDEIVALSLGKFSERDSSANYPVDSPYFKNGFDSNTQLCYANRINPQYSCLGMLGEALTAEDHIDCVRTIIGITSYVPDCSNEKPVVYTRVAYFVPWIESIVWP